MGLKNAAGFLAVFDLKLRKQVLWALSVVFGLRF